MKRKNRAVHAYIEDFARTWLQYYKQTGAKQVKIKYFPLVGDM